MNIDEIKILVASGESRTLELKKTTGELKDGMHTACAFLNTEGGWLLFGVTPEAHKIVGQKVTDNTQREIALALGGIEPMADVSVEYVDIPENPDNKVIAMHFDGWVWGELSIKAWVNIMYGCDEFCTYCIVPYTRGKERSRLPEDIIAEIQHLAAEGYQEVTLLGQNVNAYGKDFKDREYTFGDLLNDLNKIDVPRIRFTTSHPRDFDEKTIAALAKRGNLVEHIHLPVQSGNNEVLKRMNRKYTREMYLQLVRDLKAAIPGVSITTDIIVGFPGETEEQFQDTLSLVEEVGYEGAFTFIFSPREGTPAARMEDNVSEADKKDRLNRLNEAINRGFRAGNKRFEGQIVDVLVEGTSKNDDTMLAGYTRHNKLVNFKGDASKIGQIVNVKITEAKTWHLAGEMVNDDTTN